MNKEERFVIKVPKGYTSEDVTKMEKALKEAREKGEDLYIVDDTQFIPMNKIVSEVVKSETETDEPKPTTDPEPATAPVTTPEPTPATTPAE